MAYSDTTSKSPYTRSPTETPIDSFIRWARLEKYRIEVTYGVYVYTPGEKLAFWTVFLFLFAAISTAGLLFVHRNLTLLVRVIANSASHGWAAKQRMPELTTGAGDILSTARNSQIA
ncbi:hypothetical protein GGR57DRAFT_223514 [Xylariaceae sp. FL1272]|nr:hypothetical protein GGR57DRAFT_223514 [Xylariaceae sp. FL1272]